jgi:tetratricopeptide (TPR) repeat protein
MSALQSRKGGISMRGCLRKLGIFIGVLTVLAAVFALVFWLNWERKTQLTEQASNAYKNGNAVEALAYYQKLMDRYSLTERTARKARDRADELELYLDAASLQEEGQTEGAIAAYEKYLDEHFNLEWRGNIYGYRAREAFAILKPQQAQKLHEHGDYAEAVGVYMSLLEIEMLEIDGCNLYAILEETACQDAEAAIEQNQLAAQEAIPALILEWTDAIEQQGNYQEFADHCERILLENPEMLSNKELKRRIAQVYNDWAVSLRQAESYNAAIEVYETILRGYSETPTGQLAKAALGDTRAELDILLQENPAIPVVEFSEELSRDDEDVWVLTTVFKEIGGKVGYELSGSGWIIDADGQYYGTGITLGFSVSRGPVTVPAGGETESIYSFKGDIFVDGYTVFTWEGEDEGGHPITIEERVHLLP